MNKSIRIQNYRGINDLTINDLGRVNLIVGANNVGKTSVLEALALLRMHRDEYELKQILESRGYVAGESESGALTSMCASSGEGHFHVRAHSDNESIHDLLGATNIGLEGGHRKYIANAAHYVSVGSLRLSLHFPGEALSWYWGGQNVQALSNFGGASRGLDLNPTTRFPKQDEVGPFGEVAFIPGSTRVRNRLLPEYMTELRRQFVFDPIVTALREFDARIRDVQVAASESKTSIDVELFGDDGKRFALPWTAIGDGVRRLWEMLIVLPRARNGIGLIDEVDIGIYFENLPKLWRAIDSISGNSELQIFATTHSWECVDAAKAVFEASGSDDFRLIRLERRDGKIEAVVGRLNQVEAAMALGLELR